MFQKLFAKQSGQALPNNMKKNDDASTSTEESVAKTEPTSFSRCNVAVSMTVQNMLTLDQENMTFTAMLEIDFKYKLKDFIDLFKLGHLDLEASNFEFPYIICNMVASEELRSTHFFRTIEGDQREIKAHETSMYGDPDSVKHTLDPNTDTGNLIKCEKHCITGTFRYHSNSAHQPFDEIFAFLKLATDGRPGTEYTTLTFHDSDSSFVAFRKNIRDYFPIDDPVPLDVAMSHEYKERSGPTYPRVYVFQRFRHRWLEDLMKFYILPACLPVLLFFSAQDSGSDSIIETIALASGLILADIALLFVNNSPDLTFSEQSLIFNLSYIIVGSVVSSFIGGSSIGTQYYKLSIIIFVLLSLPISMLLAWIQNRMALKKNEELVKYLNERNFDYLKDLV